MSAKKPWASKTMWGAAMLLVSMILGSAGVDVPLEEQATVSDKIVAVIENVTAVVGWIMVVYGRWVARGPVALV